MNIAGITNKAGLANWYTRLRNRDRRQAGVVLVGDSITESYNVSTYSARLAALLRDTLRDLHPTSGTAAAAQGYVPCRTILNPYPPTTTTGSPATSTVHGLGLKAYSVTNAASVTWTSAYATRVAVWHAQATSLVGNGIVAIDGVDVATLTGAAGVYTAGTRWLSAELTPGNHTINVRGAGGFSFPVWGAEFFDGDHDKGVHVYDGAHWGYSTAQYTDSAGDRHWQAVGAMKPGVVVVNLGTNDWITRTPAAYLANIDTILGWIASYTSVPHSVLLVGPWKPGKTGGVDSEWATMMAGLQARATGNVAFLGLQPPWPDLYPGVANSLMQETPQPLHPNDAGTAAYADLLAQALRLPETREPQPTTTRLTPASLTNRLSVTSKVSLS